MKEIFFFMLCICISKFLISSYSNYTLNTVQIFTISSLFKSRRFDELTDVVVESVKADCYKFKKDLVSSLYKFSNTVILQEEYEQFCVDGKAKKEDMVKFIEKYLSK